MLINLNEKQVGKKSPKQSFYMLYDDIDNVAAKEISQWILDANFCDPEERPEILSLCIFSAGGCLHSTFSIIDFMRGSSIPVRTIATGMIASGGTMIFLAGKKGMRTLTENTSIMSHVYTGGSYGKSHELVAATKEHELTTERMLKHYMKCTGLSSKDVEKYLLPKQDVYLSAEEALKYGICDTVTKLK